MVHLSLPCRVRPASPFVAVLGCRTLHTPHAGIRHDFDRTERVDRLGLGAPGPSRA